MHFPGYFTHKLTPPRTSYKVMKCLALYIVQKISYPWVKVPANRQNFGNPRTLAPRNKKDSPRLDLAVPEIYKKDSSGKDLAVMIRRNKKQPDK